MKKNEILKILSQLSVSVKSEIPDLVELAQAISNVIPDVDEWHGDLVADYWVLRCLQASPSTLRDTIPELREDDVQEYVIKLAELAVAFMDSSVQADTRRASIVAWLIEHNPRSILMRQCYCRGLKINRAIQEAWDDAVRKNPSDQRVLSNANEHLGKDR